MKKKIFSQQQNRTITRRQFLTTTAASAATFSIATHKLLAQNDLQKAPARKLNIASIGAGGMAASNINAVSDQNIVALCDVDDNSAAGIYKKFPDVPKYRDYRVMLDKEKDIEAVIIATPDHTHAVAAMAAIQMGKHVYVQKPMTYTIKEARLLTEAARKYKVVTQMGNQGHSNEAIRIAYEWIRAGAIGPVREVHAWTNRPIWPQGIDRPKDTPPIPQTLDWDLWLGPAQHRPYHPSYLPFSWRGWWDFGTGALGDMGCHVIDPPFWSLDLTHPTSVEAISTKVNAETYPLASIVKYEFPARGDMPPLTFKWYDGGLKPFRPAEMEPERLLPDNGVLYIGDKGVMLAGHGGGPRLIPETKMQDFLPNRPPKTLPRIKGTHEHDWVSACIEGRQACSNFDYAGPLTETVLLGNLALRRPGRKLLWDGPNLTVTNDPEVDQFVHRTYREGWSL